LNVAFSDSGLVTVKGVYCLSRRASTVLTTGGGLNASNALPSAVA
jgi:hypothetical protein